MDRYKKTTRHVMQVKNSSSTTLRVRPFTNSLCTRPPKTMNELQERAIEFLHIEEDMCVFREPIAGDRNGEQREEGKEFVGDDNKESNSRPKDLPRRSKFHQYTPLNVNSKKHCRCHKNLGHNMEECSPLHDKMKKLIQVDQVDHLQ